MENFLLLNILSLRQNLEQLEVFLDELPTKPIAIVLTETRSSNDENPRNELTFIGQLKHVVETVRVEESGFLCMKTPKC